MSEDEDKLRLLGLSQRRVISKAQSGCLAIRNDYWWGQKICSSAGEEIANVDTTSES
jgi:hypothetical protein